MHHLAISTTAHRIMLSCLAFLAGLATAGDSVNLPPATPGYAEADGTTTPTGDYRVMTLHLRPEGAKNKIRLLVGLRGNKAVNAWFVGLPSGARDSHNRAWTRLVTVAVEGTTLGGRIALGHADGPHLFLDLQINGQIAGNTITGTFQGMNMVYEPHAEKQQGTFDGLMTSEAELAVTNGFMQGKNWPDYFGVTSGMRGPDSGIALVEDLIDARPVWKSEETFGTAWGNGPDGRYGAETARKCNINCGSSSPVMSDGRIYFYYYAPNGEVDEDKVKIKWVSKGESLPLPISEKLMDMNRATSDDVVVCIDAITGKTLWRTVFKTRNANPQTHKWRSYNPTPAVRDGVVVVANYRSCFYGLDAQTGKPLWEHTSTRSGSAMASMITPIFCGNVVVVSGQSGSLALDPRTGKEAWRNPGINPIRWSVANGEYVILRNPSAREKDKPSEVTAIDPASGKTLWATPVQCWGYYPLIDGDLLVGLNKQKSGPQITCHRMSATGATLLWSESPPLKPMQQYSMAVGNGHAYVDTEGMTACIALDTGKTVGTLPFGVGYCHASYIAEGRLINHLGFNSVMAYAMADANPKSFRQLGRQWDPPQPWTTMYDVQPIVNPLVDGRLIVRGRDAVYCYDLRKPSPP